MGYLVRETVWSVQGNKQKVKTKISDHILICFVTHADGPGGTVSESTPPHPEDPNPTTNGRGGRRGTGQGGGGEGGDPRGRKHNTEVLTTIV